MSYAAGCRGKNAAWTQWSQAEEAARRLRRGRSNNAAPYRCGYCGLIHLGTGQFGSGAERRAKQRIKRRIEERWRSEW